MVMCPLTLIDAICYCYCCIVAVPGFAFTFYATMWFYSKLCKLTSQIWLETNQSYVHLVRN